MTWASMGRTIEATSSPSWTTRMIRGREARSPFSRRTVATLRAGSHHPHGEYWERADAISAIATSSALHANFRESSSVSRRHPRLSPAASPAREALSDSEADSQRLGRRLPRDQRHDPSSTSRSGPRRSRRALEVLDQRPNRPPTGALRAEPLATRAVIEAALGRRIDAERHAEEAVELSRYADVGYLAHFGRVIVELRSGNLRSREQLVDLFLDAYQHAVIDPAVVAYRAYPPILKILGQDHRTSDVVSMVLGRSNDHGLARDVGVPLAPADVARPEMHGLTPREHEVLSLMCEGLSNREIAQRLYIVESTTKVHLRRVLRNRRAIWLQAVLFLRKMRSGALDHAAALSGNSGRFDPRLELLRSSGNHSGRHVEILGFVAPAPREARSHHVGFKLRACRLEQPPTGDRVPASRHDRAGRRSLRCRRPQHR